MLKYIVDAGWHTLACERCGDRWSLIGDRAIPRYDAEHHALANHTPQDPQYDEDKCIPVARPAGLRRKGRR